MRRAKLVAALLSASAIYSALTVAQVNDPPPAEMLTEGYFAKKRAMEPETRELITVTRGTFRDAYRRESSPKLVFLFGESFSGLVTDWHSHHRLAVDKTTTGNQGTEHPDSQRLVVAEEYRSTAGRHRSQMLNGDQWRDYESGFRRVLLDYGIKMVNRELAMRLLDSEIRESTGRPPEADTQRLEMDMLRKHSKMIVEVMPYQESGYQKDDTGYHVTITLLEDASLLADDRIAIPEAVREYRSGTRGYSKQRAQNIIDIKPGKRGYDLVEQSPDVWHEHGELAAQATLQLLYDRWLRNE